MPIPWPLALIFDCADSPRHIQALSFAAMLFESQYHIPSYGHFYENETDHRQSYGYVRELLQLRQHIMREAALQDAAARAVFCRATDVGSQIPDASRIVQRAPPRLP